METIVVIVVVVVVAATIIIKLIKTLKKKAGKSNGSVFIPGQNGNNDPNAQQDN